MKEEATKSLGPGLGRKSAMGKKILMMILVFAFAMPGSGGGLTEEARLLFDKGTELLARNNHDSTLATREGLERGIELVRRAIDLGYPDAQDAYLVLAEALNELALAHLENQEERFSDVITYRDQIYRRLLQLFPESAEVLFENAFVTQDPKDRAELLRRAVQANPDHAESSFYLGMYLIEIGDFEKGVPMARRGVEHSDALVFLSYSQSLLGLLRESGLSAEARGFEKRSKELRAEKLGPL